MPLVSIHECLQDQQRLPACSSRSKNWGTALTVDQYTADSEFSHYPQPRDHHIVVCFTAGSGRLQQVRDGKRFTSTLRMGDFLIIPAGQEAGWDGSLPENTRMRLPVNILSAACEAARELTSERCFELEAICRERDPYLARVAAFFSFEMDQPEDPSQQLIVESATTILAQHLVRRYCSQRTLQWAKTPGISSYRLNRVLEYIDAHISSSIRLQDLANTAGVSPFHFIRAFRAGTGVTPLLFVEQVRIQRAQELLWREPMLSIGDVGRKVGFANASHFSRRFAAHVQQTPSRYRKSLA